MNDAYIEVEFSELYIELTKTALHQFIKRMMSKHYSLYWRYDAKTIYLMIELEESVHELPFVRNPEFLTLSVTSLHIYDETLAEAIEKLLQAEKGNGIVKRVTEGPHYITSYRAGDIESMIEIDGSEKVMMNRNGSMIQYRDDGKSLEPQTLYNMMNLEIDYVLMELHEAILDSDQLSINNHKKKLKKLLSRREQVQHLLAK
ncbi:hypothetical protein AJ85_13440 [Alkalihalobacillus alcalophilus ATCC 27647 = CGMCC 1.3604]|uniref:Uncharacterized protein n=1 Tax=Alkalihalobacillus alcalophilus ATCC 27647 = CGMCC 1.3604 TaxID=1218173 RepID=A0A094WN29_ALKAL|nr:hypothetical protein [Alkalihalobacillus alcalophilus]KGA97373.1 hypothetical protein BALCAV_0210715 [Alkalihalobacillus alcalophilus ATCC 27647 = CGMCC 1.3604]MED1561918.1 hypothetical protein [Alkalihalobacillus alcalophilus]THG90073.1 hypothetical protein AJ85_13440 [Alkalihalobacillus alcalophilus ATCC 27647 = CGMCC 1.3604]